MAATDRALLIAVIVGGLTGLGLTGAGALVGRGLEMARTGDRAVTVRGLSEREVKADLAVLPLRFTATGDELSAAQAKIDADTAVVRRFLQGQGYAPAEITIGRFNVTDRAAEQYSSQNYTTRFIVSQTVTVRTNTVERAQATTRRLNELVRQGVVLQDYSPAFIFTKLNTVRPAMIKEATASARTGAVQFARDSGSELGPIKSATQGSFEILARDESGEEGEAASLWKKVRVVTTVSYQLR
jgi:hypothetical protein